MSRVVVTGGSGVVGRAVLAELAARGHEAVVYDLQPPKGDAPARFSPGDVLDQAQLVDAIRDADSVFHLAARLPQAKLPIDQLRRINVGGTRNVAEACVKNGVRRLVFASTIEMYGPQPILAALDEEAPKLFTGPYSRTKWECEEVLAEFRHLHGLESVSLRLPMVFGPGFHHERSVLRLFQLVRRGQRVPIPARDIPYAAVSAGDAARAFALAADSADAAGMSMNVAAADNPTVAAFLAEASALVGSPSRPLRVPTGLVRAATTGAKGLSMLTRGRLPTTPVELLDFALVGGAYSIERARRVMGYAPVDTCAEAWAGAYRWYFGDRRAERSPQRQPGTSRVAPVHDDHQCRGSAPTR